MYRWLCATALFVVSIAGPALCADDKPAQDDSPKLLTRLVQRFSSVVDKDVEDKLQLTDEQKAKLAKIQKQLDAKNQMLLLRAMLKYGEMQNALDKARNANDAEDLKTGALDVGILTLELIKSQRETDAKFRDILTDDQKKLYEDSKRPLRARRH
jgi:hypothetical protein